MTKRFTLTLVSGGLSCLVQAHSALTRLTILWRNKGIDFLCKDYTPHVSSFVGTVEQSLKTSATVECLAYHTANIRQTTTYNNTRMSLSDVRRSYFQPLRLASVRGSVMSADTIVAENHTT